MLQKGIEPDWADFQNKYGGRWVIEWKDQDLRYKDDIDSYWMEILFILIGEHGDPYNNIVNGAVINVRKNKFRIGVWLKVGRFSFYPLSFCNDFENLLSVREVRKRMP